MKYDCGSDPGAELQGHFLPAGSIRRFNFGKTRVSKKVVELFKYPAVGGFLFTVSVGGALLFR